jgi:hypothetical protein
LFDEKNQRSKISCQGPFNMEPLGGRKTTELMVAMEQLRPANNGHFFRLPLLTGAGKGGKDFFLAEEDPKEHRKLTDKASTPGA